MRSEYDFTGGVRGKHAKAYHKGYRVTIHKTDGTTVVDDFKAEVETLRHNEDFISFLDERAKQSKVSIEEARKILLE